MTPEQKSEQLTKKFYHQITGAQLDKSFEIAMYKKSKEFKRAAQCAIICVEEVIADYSSYKGMYEQEVFDAALQYYQSVLIILKSKK